jgi:hypothetical protein
MRYLLSRAQGAPRGRGYEPQPEGSGHPPQLGRGQMGRRDRRPRTWRLGLFDGWREMLCVVDAGRDRSVLVAGSIPLGWTTRASIPGGASTPGGCFVACGGSGLGPGSSRTFSRRFRRASRHVVFSRLDNASVGALEARVRQVGDVLAVGIHHGPPLAAGVIAGTKEQELRLVVLKRRWGNGCR